MQPTDHCDAHESLSFTYSEFKRSIEADIMILTEFCFLPVPASMGKLFRINRNEFLFMKFNAERMDPRVICCVRKVVLFLFFHLHDHLLCRKYRWSKWVWIASASHPTQIIRTRWANKETIQRFNEISSLFSFYVWLRVVSVWGICHVLSNCLNAIFHV